VDITLGGDDDSDAGGVGVFERVDVRDEIRPTSSGAQHTAKRRSAGGGERHVDHPRRFVVIL
jgi:hypothetical protein